MLDQIIHVAPLVTMIISVVVAFSIYIYTQKANRRRATLDIIMKTFLDEKGTKLYDNFKALIKRDRDESDQFRLIDLADINDQNEIDRYILIDQLNSYEMISTGIRKGILDEEFYKLWFHRQFIKDFESVVSFIDEIQKSRPSVYRDFRILYESWTKKRYPQMSFERIQIVWWALTGDFKRLDVAIAGRRI